MKRLLEKAFFDRDTQTVAKKLLGKFLVKSIGGKEISVMITQTEAYDGFFDKASHASKGRTARTEVMFGPPGIFYVYLCYGAYDLLNVVTRECGYPAAVLIRGAIAGDSKKSIFNGPGKVTRCMQIDRTFNGKEAVRTTGLWFEDRGVEVSEHAIEKTARIGVAYAGPRWSAKKLRFVLSSER